MLIMFWLQYYYCENCINRETILFLCRSQPKLYGWNNALCIRVIGTNLGSNTGRRICFVTIDPSLAGRQASASSVWPALPADRRIEQIPCRLCRDERHFWLFFICIVSAPFLLFWRIDIASTPPVTANPTTIPSHGSQGYFSLILLSSLSQISPILSPSLSSWYRDWETDRKSVV